jgi:hypothetical protein
MLPVVNYARLERLKPPSVTPVPMNLNTFSVVLIMVSILCLYKRASTVSDNRRRYTTLDGYLESHST